MSTAAVIEQLVVFVILIATGYLMYRKEILTDDTAKHISALITNLCNPMLMLASILNAEERVPHERLLLTFAVVAVIYAVLILMGFLIPRLLGIRVEERNAYHMMCVYGNTGFIGIPLVQALLGNSAVIYVTVFNLYFNLLVYTHGKWILKRGRKVEGEPGFRLKDLMTPGFLLSVLSLLIYWFNLSLPLVVTKAVTTIGNSTTFLSMAVLGVSLSAVEVASLLKDLRLHLFVLVRFVALPIAIGLVLKAFLKDPVMVAVLTIICGVPAGNMPLMLSHEMRLPTKTLTYGIAWSTMLSVVTLAVVLFVVHPF